MSKIRTCDHEGPSGRLVRFCGNCGELIHPKTVPLADCELRHGLKRDIGYLFCVDCGAPLSGVPAPQPAPPTPREGTDGDGARVLEFTGRVRT